MKVKEIIRQLVEAENYVQARLTVCDDFIEVVKDHMPVYWDLIKDKEEAYQALAKLFAHLKK